MLHWRHFDLIFITFGLFRLKNERLVEIMLSSSSTRSRWGTKKNCYLRKMILDTIWKMWTQKSCEHNNFWYNLTKLKAHKMLAPPYILPNMSRLLTAPSGRHTQLNWLDCSQCTSDSFFFTSLLYCILHCC